MIPLGSAIYGGLFADDAVAALFTDEAKVAAMIRFEAALAHVQARIGAISEREGAALAAALDTITVPPEELRAGVAESGIPVPALVAALRARLGERGAFLHWGATTQDVMDTALMMRLRDAHELMIGRLDTVDMRLAALADAHRGTVMAARTWLQQAVPTTFGLKCALWLDPLTRLHERHLPFAVQSGGAAGTLGASAGQGLATMEALATELGLEPALPWHTARDRLLEIAGWFAAVTAALGKIGGDLVLLAQSEVAEVRLGTAGGSSTMPQKQNPVGPSALVALARANAGDLATMHQASLQAHEREAGAWMAEWLTLPRMACATGAALRIAEDTLAGVEPDAARMRVNLDASHGAVLAEAASFALADHMPRADAQALVKAAAQRIGPGAHLIDLLAEESGAPVDWAALRDPAAQTGEADAIIDRVLAAWRERSISE